METTLMNDPYGLFKNNVVQILSHYLFGKEYAILLFPL